MLLADFRYEEIKKYIVELFTQLNINSTPINGFEIAVKLGIEVIPYSAFKNQSGVVESMKKMSTEGFTDGSRIFYNDDGSNCYERINWTILHELAHILLKHSEDSELAEAEAQFFAGYAIAPPVLIYKLNIENPEELSDVFGLSFEASGNAFKRYVKWLNYGGKYYTDYEIQLCKNFGIAV